MVQSVVFTHVKIYFFQFAPSLGNLIGSDYLFFYTCRLATHIDALNEIQRYNYLLTIQC